MALLDRRSIAPETKEWIRRDFEETRCYAVMQCTDPTFWASILEEGRLYDRETGDFSIPLEEKYPGAVDLFEPRQLLERVAQYLPKNRLSVAKRVLTG